MERTLTQRLVHVSLVAATLVLAAVATPSFAQTGTVRGVVLDESGAPIAGAEVAIAGTKLHAPTDDHGRFEITGVASGAWTVRALLLGYKPSTASVTVDAGGAAEVTLRLEKAPILLKPVEVQIGSRAKHTAADELAVPVDVFNSEVMARQGSTETSQVLQALAPAINFPHQSVTDATDIVRPFTLRGLTPDETLVLVNGWRQHQTALVNTFAYGTPAGSSGVDLNTIPSSAIDHIEVLRDGASAQYGSDAIAGVVNLVTRKGRFSPFVNLNAGQYDTADYSTDGKTFNASGGWGIPVGRGSLGIFGEALDREPTNRAWADPWDPGAAGVPDVVNSSGQVTQKNNTVEQPNQHWGDGLEKDWLSMLNLRLPLNDQGTRQFYSFGGYSFRKGTGYGYKRYADSDRNWSAIYPDGFLPTYVPLVHDWSLTAGMLSEASAWKLDGGASFGHSDFDYRLSNSLNSSLGGSLTQATAPGPDGILGNADDPGIPNQTNFECGTLARDETNVGLNASTEWKTAALANPVNVSLGAMYRYERYQITPGERASWINGGALNQNGGDPIPGSQVFPGFSPSDAEDAHRDNVGAYAEFENALSSQWLANVATRFEHYSDFGSVLTGKLALRFQPAPRVVFRGAVSNGFRAPGLSQMHFSKIVTNFIAGQAVDVGVFPVDHPAAMLLGSKPLKDEKSVNLSGGIAVTPVDGLTLTADAYQITITDRIILGATFASDSTVAILARNGYGSIGGVQYFTNGIDTRTRGVDLAADWKFSLPHDHALDLSASANWTQNRITRVAPVPEVLANANEPGILDVVTKTAIEVERPDWRGMLTGTWTHGPAHGLARVSGYGKFTSAQPGYCSDCLETYGAKTLVDAEAGYKVQGVDVSIGARNLFDTYPDKAKLDYNNNFATFPWAAASPFGYNGRYLYTRASWALAR